MNSASDELEKLRTENARLRALLDAHGIDSRPPLPPPAAPSPPESSRLNPDEKVVLFRRLFQGRVDTYPIRWESKAGKSGYSPACANEWRPGVCEKPRIKCSDCGNRLLIPLSDQIIYDHLAGRHTIGVYDLMNLRFRFNDLKLTFRPNHVAEITPANAQCHVLVSTHGEVTDSRPIVVAEFDPQHVMEEAILWPEPVPLPDLELDSSVHLGDAPNTPGDRAHIIQRLKELNDRDSRAQFRMIVQQAKVDAEAKSIKGNAPRSFQSFASQYASRAASEKLPTDQRVYIGGYALDADAMAIARSVQKNIANEDMLVAINAMLARVNGPVRDALQDKRLNLLSDVNQKFPEEAAPSGGTSGAASTQGNETMRLPPVSAGQWRNALRNEDLFEQQEPLYKLFRDSWRDQITRAKGVIRNSTQLPSDKLIQSLAATPSDWFDE